MKSKDNFATEGLSGTYKQVVFRQWNGETILAKRPKQTKARSAAQQTIVENFTHAAAYAKAAMTDIALKMAYKLKAGKGLSAFNRAVVDFFKAPVIGDIDHSGYNGQAGGILLAMVTDDFQVASVKVIIKAASGAVIEQGDASLLPNGLHWMYVSTVANSAIAGTAISFEAKDLPGNLVTKIKTL